MLRWEDGCQVKGRSGRSSLTAVADGLLRETPKTETRVASRFRGDAAGISATMELQRDCDLMASEIGKLFSEPPPGGAALRIKLQNLPLALAKAQLSE